MTTRPHPKKPGYWIIDCRPFGYAGKRVRMPFEGTEEDALAIERTIMRQGEPVAAVQTIKRLGALWPQYVAWCRTNLSPAKVRDAESCWRNHLKTHFGDIYPKMLSRQIVEQYKAKRAQEYRRGKVEYGLVTKRTVTKELCHLSALIRWAIDNEYCDPLPFQVKGYPAKQTRPPKRRPLLPQHIADLLAHLEPEYRLPFLLMADGGLRVTEALTMRKSQIDLDSGVMYVKGKGEKERLVPVTTDRLSAELRSRMTTPGEYLSPNKKTGKPYVAIKKPLLRAAKAAGIEQHVHHHLLRHTFGTTAVMAGADLASVKEMMGHSSLQTTQIYLNMAAAAVKVQGRKLNLLVVQESCPHGHTSKNTQQAETIDKKGK